jgi:hypothetical protein
MCFLNGPDTIYKLSTSKRRSQKKHKRKAKQSKGTRAMQKVIKIEYVQPRQPLYGYEKHMSI